jgi:hypothetical protein
MAGRSSFQPGAKRITHSWLYCYQGMEIDGRDRGQQDIVMSPGFLERLGPGGVHLSMSTVSPQTARKLAEVHARQGNHYVEAPV